MKRPIILGLTALTVAATLAPINVKAAGVDYTKAGNKQVIVLGGNCDNSNIQGQIQENIQSIIENVIQNGCGNYGSGSVDNPNVDEPTTDKPTTDKPTTDKPTTDKPTTDKPITDKPGTDTEDTQNPTQSSYAQRVVELVNVERAKEGLSPLTMDANITVAANIRANEIQSSFSHTRPNGSNFYSVLTEQGINYRSSGENIAYGQKTPEQVVTGWMNSEGHRANIMNKNFKNIGVGYQVSSNGTPYWVQLFTA